MLSYTELRKGVLVTIDGEPYEVIESSFLRMQQRKAVVQTKLRNLITGKIYDRNWQASDNFEEAEVERKQAMFLYNHRGEFWFSDPKNPKNRSSLPEATIGDPARFLKPNTVVETVVYDGKVITVRVPIKMELKVTEAPPSIKGNTAQGGTKQVTLETGATINVPLFVNQDDIIRVNTETGEYVERVEKN